MNDLEIRTDVAFEGRMTRAAVFTVAAIIVADKPLAFIFCIGIAALWAILGLIVRAWPEQMLSSPEKPS